jgi:hypothetical protein
VLGSAWLDAPGSAAPGASGLVAPRLAAFRPGPSGMRAFHD